jgi:hypothetical protein
MSNSIFIKPGVTQKAAYELSKMSINNLRKTQRQLQYGKDDPYIATHSGRLTETENLIEYIEEQIRKKTPMENPPMGGRRTRHNKKSKKSKKTMRRRR